MELIRGAQLLKFDVPEDALAFGLRSKKRFIYQPLEFHELGSKDTMPAPQQDGSFKIHDEILQIMVRLFQRVGIIHLSAMKPIPKDKGTDDMSISIRWRLDVSVRSQRATICTSWSFSSAERYHTVGWS